MKNSILLFISILFISTTFAFSQSSMLEKGFSAKFSFGFPPDAYGYDGDFPLPEELLLNTTYGFEIGNQWYFYTNEQFGIGLDVNWLDVVYGKSKMDVLVGESVKRLTLEGSFLEFGPLATFAFNDIFAIEGYYNLRPSYMATYYYENEDDNLLIYDFGFLHGLGIGARFKFLYVGYEYTFGNIEGGVTGWGELEEIADMLSEQTLGAANSKLILGFQF